MTFHVLGCDPAPFRHLHGRSDDELRGIGAPRHVVDAHPGFPARIAVRDVALGETVLLLNHVHQPADTPYRASRADFVREHAEACCDLIDAVPEAMCRRPISPLAFSHDPERVGAILCEGFAPDAPIANLMARPDVAYPHAHEAVRSCYAARSERAGGEQQ